VTAALAPLARAAGTVVAPIHGDLHVGQILRAGEPTRFLVIDFDGSPTDTPAQRREPQPVARDVASMLASWDHVGRVVLHRTQGLESAHRERVLAWIERSQRAFLETYAAELAAAGRADLLDRRLVRPYQVLQECREYAYARRYLPHWRYVPDAALPALLARPEGSAA
jgi:maltokinase